METIRINKKKPIYSEKTLSPNGFYLPNKSSEYAMLSFNDYQTISSGDTIHFERVVSSEKYETDISVGDSSVLVHDILDNQFYYINLPEAEKNYITNVQVADNGEGYYLITFEGDCHLFAQDFTDGYATSETITATNGIKTWTISDILFVEENEDIHPLTSGITAQEVLLRKTLVRSYGCESGETIENAGEQYFIPTRIRQNMIIGKVTLESSYDPLEMIGGYAVFEKSVFYDSNGTLYEGTTFSLETGFWEVPVKIATNSDDIHLHQEEIINETLSEKYLSKIIPEVIDMEKVKYIPTASSGETSTLINKIEFRMHFRERKTDGTWSYNENSSGWTGISDYTEIGKPTEPRESDLLSKLGFVDDDVLYQKNCVKKSFLRILFYDSNDPLTQKLLFYSTVFFDGGELYGKALNTNISCYNELSTLSGDTKVIDKSPDVEYERFDTEIKTVSMRIDSKITVTSEYDTTRSSEGYNLYLFESDAPENAAKTIYMKVEFNHAKYGRTIPLIAWPIVLSINLITGEIIEKSDKLLLNDYKDWAFIPIQIVKYGSRCQYNVSNILTKTIYIIDNDQLIFDLYEPRIEPEEK